MFKKTLVITALTLITLLILSGSSLQQRVDTPPEIPGTYKISIGKKGFSVYVADEAMEQITGLSGREKLPDRVGMLFILSSPMKLGFWMKDMKFAIDIVWMAENGVILGIEKNIAPETYPTNFYPPSPVKYVMEISAGNSDENDIKPGDILEFSGETCLLYPGLVNCPDEMR